MGPFGGLRPLALFAGGKFAAAATNTTEIGAFAAGNLPTNRLARRRKGLA